MWVSWGLIFVGLAATVRGTPVDENAHHAVPVAKEFLTTQLKVLHFFKGGVHLNKIEEYKMVHEHQYTFCEFVKTHKNLYMKPEAVQKILEFCHYDYMLPKHEIFTIGQEQHLEQAIALFKLFYYAKDIESLFVTAVAAHPFINKGLLYYSFSVALTHRPDCYGVIIPPIYELNPRYFFNADVIQEVYEHKLMETDGEHEHIVHANYSTHHQKLHTDQSLSYYLEDIGINAFHYNVHLHYPYWMDGEEFKIKNDKRGELSLDIIHFLTSRYYFERLSNFKGDISVLDFNVPVEIPYKCSLQYHTGDFFPTRPNHVDLHEVVLNNIENEDTKYQQSWMQMQMCEQRLAAVVDGGFVITKDGKVEPIYNKVDAVNIFGNLLHANVDSPHHQFYCSYMAYAKHILGYAHSPTNWHHVVPSVLSHPETCLRDPAVYAIYKKLMLHYEKFQHHFKPYTKEQLISPGVTIQKVEMDRLITYFDTFYTDVSMVVEGIWKHPVHAVQYRLNHKPFTFKIHVKSDTETQVVVKVFVGPKYDENGKVLNMTVNRFNFMPIDSFKWTLTQGDNIIKRSSSESEFYGGDKTTFSMLEKKISDALEGTVKFHATADENYYFFPDRFMLPKGTVGGFPCQFYFYIYPYDKKHVSTLKSGELYPLPGTGGGYIDDTPTYHPLDKPIKYEKLFTEEVPNSYLYYTKIYLSLPEAEKNHNVLPY